MPKPITKKTFLDPSSNVDLDTALMVDVLKRERTLAEQQADSWNGRDLRSAWRDVIDKAISVMALVVLIAPMVVCSIVILASLGRPLMFSQKRAGLHGRPFMISKFRTMSEATDALGMLLPDSARENRWTKVLRRFRLDELPQFLSILRGDMNLVGPRPLLESTIVNMEHLGKIRGRVRPGMTGWAQLNGGPHLSEADKIALDVWYVDHQSFALDMLIFARTILVVIGGDKVDTKNVERAQRYVGDAYPGSLP